MENKRKIVRSTKAQLKILNDYMATHRAFANNEYTGPLGNTKYMEEWEKLRMLLRDHAPDKSVEQWRHTWRDLKKKARNEVALARRAHVQTGNIIKVSNVSEEAYQILDTIGHECAVGIGGEESRIGNVEIEFVPPLPEFNIPILNADRQFDASQPGPSGCVSQTGPSRSDIPQPGPSRSDISQPGPSRSISQPGPSQPISTRPRPQPTAGTAQRRRTGLGVRAREFLMAEAQTTEVLKDIRNLMMVRNKLLEEQNEILRKKYGGN